MNVGNILLIGLAILLLWGAINLDRTSQRRVVEDQSSQLNDTMEFLRKVKGREPKDESNSRRINAYTETVNRAIKENPEYLRQIEKDFEDGTSSNSNQIEKIIESTDKITSNLDEIQSKTAEVKAKQAVDSQHVVENLTKLVQSINAVEIASQEFSQNSAVLSQNIAEVNHYLS
ncbi:MAG: hypothetical protein CMA02_02815 [Euryarchaeota archaeon]|nr:hypothetical protein [Euryarchaeota archaeon]|tara:strand:- start:494 stop:1015 length:522 start_codon:yes stop_codon:yes gene_type:complete